MCWLSRVHLRPLIGAVAEHPVLTELLVVVSLARFAEAVFDIDTAGSRLLLFAVGTPEALWARDVGAEVSTDCSVCVAVFSGNAASVNRTLGPRGAGFVGPLVAWNDAVSSETLQSRWAEHPPAEVGRRIDGRAVNLIASRFGQIPLVAVGVEEQAAKGAGRRRPVDPILSARNRRAVRIGEAIVIVVDGIAGFKGSFAWKAQRRAWYPGFVDGTTRLG